MLFIKSSFPDKTSLCTKLNYLSPFATRVKLLIFTIYGLLYSFFKPHTICRDYFLNLFQVAHLYRKQYRNMANEEPDHVLKARP
jgi:hypothetical protein